MFIKKVKQRQVDGEVDIFIMLYKVHIYYQKNLKLDPSKYANNTEEQSMSRGGDVSAFI